MCESKAITPSRSCAAECVDQDTWPAYLVVHNFFGIDQDWLHGFPGDDEEMATIATTTFVSHES
jgi:hypothetical protein